MLRQSNSIKEGVKLCWDTFGFWREAMKPNSGCGKMLATGKGIAYVLFWKATSGIHDFGN